MGIGHKNVTREVLLLWKVQPDDTGQGDSIIVSLSIDNVCYNKHQLTLLGRL